MQFTHIVSLTGTCRTGTGALYAYSCIYAASPAVNGTQHDSTAFTTCNCSSASRSISHVTACLPHTAQLTYSERFLYKCNTINMQASSGVITVIMCMTIKVIISDFFSFVWLALTQHKYSYPICPQSSPPSPEKPFASHSLTSSPQTPSHCL